MSKRKVLCFILSAVSAAVFTSCGKKAPMDAPSEENSGQNVTVYTAAIQPISSSVTYTGEIKASESVSISSKVSAKAKTVYFQEGDYVKAGAVLAKLDDTDVALSLKQAEASYNSAVANYNMVVNSSTKQAAVSAEQNLNAAQLSYDSALSNYNREKELYEQNSSIKLAEQSYNDAVTAYNRQKELYDNNTTIISAQNAVTTAQQNLERTKQLFDMGAASQVELDTAETTAANAQAALDSAVSGAKTQLDSAYSAMKNAEENYKTTKISASAAFENAENALKNAENALKNAKENIQLTKVSSRESISTAAANVEASKASLATARNTMNNTAITAPISGFIASKSINEGQMVPQGAEIFSIKNADNVDAEISVTEAVIPYITVGTPARITIKSADMEEKEGTVTLVNSVKDQATGMYTVRVSIPNPGNEIKVGMFADISLTVQQSNSSVVIPSDSLLQEDDEMYVYVANGNTAEKRVVLLGIQNSDYSEILSGVEEGEDVVVSGKEYISESNNELNITSKEGE
ncbi:MAG: efflux RND transporter periplasmic adaptor subunit [Clostridia bacterium]|nr:efflux RND transporter periplasmic adaptor subunit [Clostridia bacterium]